MRCDLEREITARQTVQLQLESKEQLVASLKAQLEARLAATDHSAMLASSLSRSAAHDLVSVISIHRSQYTLFTAHIA